jgi:hypothetical protein
VKRRNVLLQGGDDLAGLYDDLEELPPVNFEIRDNVEN